MILILSEFVFVQGLKISSLFIDIRCLIIHLLSSRPPWVLCKLESTVLIFTSTFKLDWTGLKRCVFFVFSL